MTYTRMDDPYLFIFIILTHLASSNHSNNFNNNSFAEPTLEIML